ncbi:MAG TPA: DUF934 domain-containing protein [Burkholderiales bacterium]|nr:DUF934 domain-containing protein [Burkholderiales bacterium]
MALIKHRKLAPDSWQLLEPDADGTLRSVPAEGDVIVPFSVWETQRAELIARSGQLGVWLAGNEDPVRIAGDLQHFVLVAVKFPALPDGRGYSIGRLLRERYRWDGELRAIGDIQRDQLYYLARCGFDAYVLRAGENIESALAAFDDFSEAYQAAVDRPVPLFRRREAAASS